MSQNGRIGPGESSLGPRAFGVYYELLLLLSFDSVCQLRYFWRISEQRRDEGTHDRPKRQDCPDLFDTWPDPPAGGLLEVAEASTDRDRQIRTHTAFRDRCGSEVRRAGDTDNKRRRVSDEA